MEKSNPLKNLKVIKKEWPQDNFPFTQASSPIIIETIGKQVPSWGIDEYGLTGVLPDETDVKSSQVDNITLVPMGAARLRISAFPTTE
jgi:hypothetical protein